VAGAAKTMACASIDAEFQYALSYGLVVIEITHRQAPQVKFQSTIGISPALT
jgi:hypothetical protein